MSWKLLTIPFVFGLIGLCISANAQTLKKSSSTSINQNGDWKIIQIENLIFSAPKAFYPKPLGIGDSSMWSYRSKELLFQIEIGPYAHFNPYYRTKPNYKEETFNIDGAEILVCFNALEEQLNNYKYVSSAYLAQEKHSEPQFRIDLFSADSEGYELAKRIFKSIKFTRKTVK